MFKHVVLLNRSPWFIYARDEVDALQISSQLEENVVGVACSDTEIEVKKIEVKAALFSENQKLLESNNENESDDSSDELQDELDKAVDQAFEEEISNTTNATESVLKDVGPKS